jgi:hypothetical protein
MAFSALTITNAGMHAINDVLAGGHTLATTGGKAGSGYPATGDDVTTYTALKNYVMDLANVSANALVIYQTTVEAQLSSANAPFEFQVNELGVYASLDGGVPFLFSYTSTGGPTGDTVTPSGTANAVVKDYVLATAYSQTVPISTNITLETAPALHAPTHLPSGTDPLPISSSSIGGLCPKTNNDATQVLLGGGTASFGVLPPHAPTHLDNARTRSRLPRRPALVSYRNSPATPTPGSTGRGDGRRRTPWAWSSITPVRRLRWGG